MKKCIECELTLPLTSFWHAGRGKKYYQSRCKKCHMRVRKRYKRPSYDKIPSGFLKLPDETREKIIEMLKNRVQKKIIADEFKINYNTFKYWTRSIQLN